MRSKGYIVVISLFAIVGAMFPVIRHVRAQQQPPAGLTITTGDLSRPYEVIAIAFSYQQFKASFTRDPLVNAFLAADAELRRDAKQFGADAIVALRLDFENRTEKDEGRLFVYGTLVRFK